MSYTPVDLVEVRVADAIVGAVAADPRSGYYAFEYADSWLRRGIELAPLTLPNQRSPRVFPNLAVNTYQRLPAMLADALPDAFGNSLINAFLAREGVAAARITPLDRLAYLGTRGMGAFEFHPPTQRPAANETAFEMATLVAEARRAVHGSFGSERDATDGLRHLLQVGTSAGGARAKAVIAWNPDTGEIRSGQLSAPDGFEQWLLKFDGVIGVDVELGLSGDYGRIEFAYHHMAIAAGIDMLECRLLEEGGRAHFMTRRFDRLASGAKVHIQSLCAMAELDFNVKDVHDYAQLMNTIDALDMGPDQRAAAFRRAVFNVAAANCDDHTKNHAFVLDADGWRLSPAFDITHAHNPDGEWTSRHLMGIDGVFLGADRDHLLRFADRFEIPGAKQIISDVNDAIASWSDFAQRAGLPTAAAAHVAADLRVI